MIISWRQSAIMYIGMSTNKGGWPISHSYPPGRGFFLMLQLLLKLEPEPEPEQSISVSVYTSLHLLRERERESDFMPQPATKT